LSKRESALRVKDLATGTSSERFADENGTVKANARQHDKLSYSVAREHATHFPPLHAHFSIRR